MNIKNLILSTAILAIFSGCTRVGFTDIKTTSRIKAYNLIRRGNISYCLEDAQKMCGGAYAVVKEETLQGSLWSAYFPSGITWCNLKFVCGGIDQYVDYRRGENAYLSCSESDPLKEEINCTNGEVCRYVGNVMRCKY